MQKLTKNGRPIINRFSKLPVYSKTVERRIKEVSNQLFAGMNAHETRWALIQNSVRSTLT